MKEQIYTKEIINGVLEKLIDSFYRVSMSYDPYGKEDIFDFYINGNCNSFAFIMYEIFGDCVKFYFKSYPPHTIVKISDEFYDVRGCITNKINIEEFKECSLNSILSAIDNHILFSNNKNHENEIETDLIKIGKEKLQELLEDKAEIVRR